MKNNPIDQAVEALEGSIKLIGAKVISNVMPKEQDANYQALTALRQLQEDYILVERGKVKPWMIVQYHDFKERGEIMRHNEDGMEELAEILAKTIIAEQMKD